jgi:molybdopterin-synthase adenylyltransferase
MVTPLFEKPRLPSNYDVWFEPPDDAGDETLYFVSERRRLKIKGHSFREFTHFVVPLLDGRHSFDEIAAQVASVFRPEDLHECLCLLAEQNLLEDGDFSLVGAAAPRLESQLNLFHEVQGSAAGMQKRLRAATVSVLGLAGSGATVAMSLASAGVGTIRCVDTAQVRVSDVYLSSVYRMVDMGTKRAAVVAAAIAASAPEVNVPIYDAPLHTEEDLMACVGESDYIVCCLDAGQSNIVFKLNRGCLAARVPWIGCAVAGTEVIVGPAVHPGEGPCYLCYRMRSIACAANPEDAFAHERYLDRRQQDDSGHRENLVFGAGVAASLVGMEVLKALTGLAEPALRGKIAVVDLLSCTLSKHVVLRKPLCPACSQRASKEHEAQAVPVVKEERAYA